MTVYSTDVSNIVIPDARCVVSDDYRTITVPGRERILGAVGDDETRRVWFDMPASNDGIDLTGMHVSVHYVNANGEGNRYDVDTVYIVNNHVVFGWLVGRGAYASSGIVQVSLKMRKMHGSEVLDEFNSAVFGFTVLDALDYETQPDEEVADYVAAFIEQQSARVTAALAPIDQAIADAQEATAEATTAATAANGAAAAADEATARANAAADNANQAATDIRAAAERGDFDGEKGDKGDPGEKGETGATGAPGKDGVDGISPTVTTQQTATGATITITDKNGTHTATIANGERGPQGDKGDPGELLDGSVTYDKLYQPLAEAITLKGSGSGETVTTDDAAELPLYSLMVHGKSVQDGEPTPDNPVPVETVSGANLADMSTPYTRYIQYVSPTQANWRYDAGSRSIAIPVNPNTTYYVKGYGEGLTILRGCMVDTLPTGTEEIASTNAKNNANGFSITSGADSKYLIVQANASLIIDNAAYIMVNTISPDAPYIPYGSYIGLVCGDTVTPIDMQGHELASLPDGTMDVLNMARTGAIDVLERMQAKTIESGDITQIVTGYQNQDETIAFATAGSYLPDNALGDAGLFVNNQVLIVSDQVPGSAYNNRNVDAPGIFLANRGKEIVIRMPKTVASTIEEMNAWLENNPIHAIYRHVDTTYTLPAITPPTPIDGGTVRIVANVTPEIDATWIKDATKAHGDIATTDASIAAVESTVATSNHAIGSYFMVGNQLYKATSAIATGETIAPGTNCTATTVMAELVALTS